MTPTCKIHAHNKILLICLQNKCSENRLICLHCIDQGHKKHDLVSVECFQKMMKCKLQINRANPDKTLIIKQLNKSKTDILQKLQTMKNKFIGLIGQCQDKIQTYYSKIYHSFVIDSHQMLLKDLQSNFSSSMITTLINQMRQFENITLGTIGETQSVMYSNISIFKQKISETLTTCQASLQNMSNSFNYFTIAKPKQFIYRFSRQKRFSNYLGLSDSLQSVIRINGNGGYPMCLVETPFSPIENSIVFSVDKTEGSKKSICLGVCLENIVKSNNYGNCGGGLNKGIYAIDQNSPYNSEQAMLASWNHHDTSFNQTNAGSNNLVGWTFSEGDKIRIEIDYYNSIVTFIKGQEEEWQQSQEMQVYQMPIKLNAGPIHAFVSCQNKGDKVSIKR